MVNNYTSFNNYWHYHWQYHIKYLSVHQTEHLWSVDHVAVQRYNKDSDAACRCIHECKLHSSDDHMLSYVYVAIGPYTQDTIGEWLKASSVNRQLLIRVSQQIIYKYAWHLTPVYSRSKLDVCSEPALRCAGPWGRAGSAQSGVSKICNICKLKSSIVVSPGWYFQNFHAFCCHATVTRKFI